MKPLLLMTHVTAKSLQLAHRFNLPFPFCFFNINSNHNIYEVHFFVAAGSHIVDPAML